MKALVFAIAFLAIMLMWFFRYDFQVVTSGGQGTVPVGYALNRITGTFYLVSPTLVRELKPEAPPQESKFWDEFDKSQKK